MADQELTDLEVLAVLATDDLFFVRDKSAGIDKQVTVSSLISLLPPKDLGDLGDVDLTTSTPNPGDHLEFDGTDWVPGSAGGGNLDALSDVTLTSPAECDFLQFLSGQWSNEKDVAFAGTIQLKEALATGPFSFLDGNGVILLQLATKAGTPVNYLRIFSNTAGNPVEVFATSDTEANVDLRLRAKGSASKVIISRDIDASGNICAEGTIDAEGYEIKGVAVTGGFVKNDSAGVFSFDNTIVLGDLPAISLDDLSDVDVTTATPISGDMLAFNGTVWVPASGMAPGAHASTHISAGSDEIDGDRLDIDFSPANYTQSTAPAEVTLVVELTAHLAGIDLALATFAAAVHTHVEADITDLQNYSLVGHTHVEADITDLQAYLLNITGEKFTDLSDTPSVYTAAAGQFVKVNSTPDGLEFAALTLSDLPAIGLDDLTDVDVTTATPISGDCLAFNGSLWVPTIGLAPGAHAVTHISGGTDEIDGDRLEITFVPSNYTRSTAPAEVTLVIELTAHLAGIDAEILTINNNFTGHTHVEADITDLQAYLLNINAESIDELSDVDTTSVAPISGDILQWNGTNWVPVASDTPGLHASTHVSGGGDEIDGDVLDIDFVPTNYTRSTAPGEVTAVVELTAHLAGIDDEIATINSTFTGHTHVEADITDLQNYSLVGHTHVEADITDLQAYLLDITGENIGDLSDVTLSTPADGELLRFNGSVWINNTLTEAGIAPASHTHVEADITDLQSYLLDITGEDFTDLSDTPGNYTGAGSRFVKVNVGETALEFVADPGYLLNISAEFLTDLSDVIITAAASSEFLRFNGSNWVNASISLSDLPAIALDDISDVDLTTLAPVSGDCLAFNGTLWVPASSMAPGAHASTHISAGTDEIDGDRLDIDYTPTNYTPDTTPAEVTLAAHLTSHLAGIDDVLGSAITTFIGHTDTPSTYTSTGTFFVRVNAGETALEFVADPGYLTGIGAESIDDLSDVTITTVATGEILTFTGTIWENQTLAEAGVASASHTHVEADITDLQSYLLNITGEDFTDLSDTPTDYTGAAGQFLKVNSTPNGVLFADLVLGDLPSIAIDDLSDVVITTVASGEILTFTGTVWENQTLAEAGVAAASHTHVEADITDLQAYLLNINAESIDELSDVDTSGVSSGDILQWNGSTWVPVASDTPGLHASTHVSGGGDEIDGDVLDITFVPTNYTRLTSPTEVTAVVELTAHLAGLDAELATFAAASHTHVEADITDLQSYLLNITGEDFTDLSDTPANYTGAAGQFVKVNSTPDALEFAALVLGDLPAIGIDDLSDVTITTVATGEILAFTGTVWENQTLAEAGVAAVSHTHVEADITDLQSYLLNITGEDFTDLSDTPANYTGSGAKFVRVNVGETVLEFVDLTSGDLPSHTHVEADITDLQAYLLNITNENLGDLSDVVLTAEADGELLRFNGANWINNTLAEAGVAAASHTHVEADITDLQSYLLNITGEAFTDLSDTPANYTAAGSRFVKVNSGATALEFVADPGFLLNITAEPIGDLSDVTITTPADGELLRFNGSIWINNTLAEAGVAAASHTHVEADITDLQAYLLNITGESIGDLSDVALVSAADGDFLRFNGTSWVDAVISESDISDLSHAIILQDEGSGVANTPHATLNFVGAGVAVTDAGAGVSTITISGDAAAADHDTQMATSTTTTSTNNGSYIDMPGMTLTTKNLGETGTYTLTFSAYANNQKAQRTARYRIVVGGVAQDEYLHSSQKKASDETTFSFTRIVSGIANGTVIKVQFLVDDTSGNVNVFNRALTALGTPDSRVVA